MNARDVRRQTVVGLSLAGAIAAGWLALHVYGVFLHRWTPLGIAAAPLLVVAQCWLSVGLFIIAHDAMHGSLAPFRPGLNRWIGRLCLALYAGFSYDRLLPSHFAHHRHSGTAEDPDFHAGGPRLFWPWFVVFFRRYFGWAEFVRLSAIVLAYLFVLRAPIANLLVFWAVPALLSAVQLFYFGTYLPHRQEEEAFGDEHRARSSGFAWPVSLLTCFHFGYHHEHHAMPHVPWWRLPSARAQAASGRA